MTCSRRSAIKGHGLRILQEIMRLISKCRCHVRTIRIPSLTPSAEKRVGTRCRMAYDVMSSLMPLAEIRKKIDLGWEKAVRA